MSAFNLVDNQFMEWVSQLAEEKKPFAHISEEKINEMYALAYFLYRQKHFFDSSCIFRQLTVARPAVSRYWKGLGACLQMEKEYEDALNCYASAQLLNGKNPDPYLYLHAADCYFALSNKENGCIALKSARQSAEKINDQRLLHHVKLMQEIWSKG